MRQHIDAAQLALRSARPARRHRPLPLAGGSLRFCGGASCVILTQSIYACWPSSAEKFSQFCNESLGVFF